MYPSPVYSCTAPVGFAASTSSPAHAQLVRPPLTPAPDRPLGLEAGGQRVAGDLVPVEHEEAPVRPEVPVAGFPLLPGLASPRLEVPVVAERLVVCRTNGLVQLRTEADQPQPGR